MAHEDGCDDEANAEPNMMKNENLSENGHNEQNQVEKNQQDNEDTTSPSNHSPSSYERVIECLEILQDGYAKMDPDRICQVLAENVVWMEHPHNRSKHYVGHEEIREHLNEEFADVQELKMIYFPESLIHDDKRGVAHIEWLKSKQDINPDGNHRERHSSHSVVIQFQNGKIQMIKFHSIKTNKYWTTQLVTDKLGDDEKQHKKKRRNGRNGRNGKNGSRSRKNGRRHKKRNGKNGHRGNNGRNRRNYRKKRNGNNEYRNHEEDYVEHNVTEHKPVAEEIEPIVNKTSSPPSRSRDRNRRNYNRDRGTYRRRTQKRGGRGRGKPKKKKWVPWTCSACNFHNAADSTACKNCRKKFHRKEDLVEEQNPQLQNTKKEEQQQTQPVPLSNNTESNV